jgi:hypothetical protein
VVDSSGTAEAVVTVSERVAPDAAAGTGTPWNRTAASACRVMVSSSRDDPLADRYDAIYRGAFQSRVREVA